jgi:DNA-binding MarR family transcriptional regulator
VTRPPGTEDRDSATGAALAAAPAAAPVPPPAPAAAVRIWKGIRALVLDRHDRRAQVVEALGMSFIRIKALRHLAAEPMTLRHLAAELSTDAPYTTVVVDDLARRGLVERTTHPDDRRAKIVTVTAAGLAAARKAEQLLGEPPAPLLALDADELATLDRLIAKLLAHG